VLFFFSNFFFRDEICESLESYNQEIEELRVTMDQSTNAADQIRSDIQKLSMSYGFVDGQGRCQVCEGPVLTREFYLFPCQHAFHSNCMVDQMLTNEFNDSQRQRYNSILSQIKQLEQVSAKGNLSASAVSAEETKRGKIAKLKSTLDDLVAPECLLCGTVSIRQITRPFGEDSMEARSWSLRSE
jgi:hypothetical protein